MTRMALIIALVASCTLQTRPLTAAEELDSISTRACGADCTISLTCRDVFSSCKYCSGGICTATLPADPVPPTDGGIDAAPGGTTP